jgi:hypothetical protein
VTEALLEPFREREAPDRDHYRGLVAYFAEGWLRGRSALGARVSYRGYASSRGRVCDLLEGFARMVPLFGAWVEGGRGPVLPLAEGRTLDVADAFRRGMLAGTDPASPEYWGTIGNHDQRAVESADLALALWFFRDDVWGDLRDADRSQLAAWLAQVERVRMPDNISSSSW